MFILQQILVFHGDGLISVNKKNICCR